MMKQLAKLLAYFRGQKRGHGETENRGAADSRLSDSKVHMGADGIGGEQGARV